MKAINTDRGNAFAMTRANRFLTLDAMIRLSRFATRIAPELLRRSLDEILPHKIPLLFVHASLSSCGQFLGGGDDVIDALNERADMLGFPTHTYCYPPTPLDEGPLFDRTITPSQNGLITEMFRRRPTVIRSNHATHSVAFQGKQANEICINHYECNTPCGNGTPYASMLTMKASVLLFGVTFHSYTLFHTAEDDAESEVAYEPRVVDRLRVIDEHARIRTTHSKRQSRTPRRFQEAGEHLIRLGLAKRVGLGKSYLLFVPDSAQVNDYLVSKLRKTPDFLHATCELDLR